MGTIKIITARSAATTPQITRRRWGEYPHPRKYDKISSMKAWIQRVSEAAVHIDGQCVAQIGRGYLVLLGVTHTDTEAIADQIADKIPLLRLFTDDNDHMNLSLEDVGGSVIVVSQFTLYADTAHGRRPGFSAARPCEPHPRVCGR